MTFCLSGSIPLRHFSGCVVESAPSRPCSIGGIPSDPALPLVIPLVDVLSSLRADTLAVHDASPRDVGVDKGGSTLPRRRLVQLSLFNRCQTSVPTTHSPLNSLLPVSTLSRSARNPRATFSPVCRGTVKVTGVTTASAGRGTRKWREMSRRIRTISARLV